MTKPKPIAHSKATVFFGFFVGLASRFERLGIAFVDSFERGRGLIAVGRGIVASHGEESTSNDGEE